MSLVTLADLRQQSRNRADMRINGIFTDADFNAAINQSIFELNDLLVKAWGDNYFLTSSIIPLQASQSLYALPASVTGSNPAQGVYKVVGVDWQANASGPWVTLHSYPFTERNRYSANTLVASQNCTNMRYCLYGSNVNLLPTPQTGQQIQVWFVPQPAQLVNDTDTYDFVGGWEEFVIVNTAIKALLAEESDASTFMAQKAEMKERIMDMAPQRDVSEPHRSVDVECSDNGFW